MIKNHKQYASAKRKLEELLSEKAQFEVENPNSNTAKYRFGMNAFIDLISALQADIAEYELLSTHTGLVKSKASSVRRLPEMLIKARIAKKMSHKDLATKLNIDEQQIQRYEATNYSAASWDRIVEVIIALDYKNELKDYWLGNITFTHDEQINEDRIKATEVSILKQGLFPIKAS